MPLGLERTDDVLGWWEPGWRGREGAGDGRHVPIHRGSKALSLRAWQDLEGAPTGPPASTCPEQDAELKASVSVLKMRPFRNKPPLATLPLLSA